MSLIDYMLRLSEGKDMYKLCKSNWLRSRISEHSQAKRSPTYQGSLHLLEKSRKKPTTILAVSKTYKMMSTESKVGALITVKDSIRKECAGKKKWQSK